MKEKTLKPLFESFAKDLGYKDYKELKDALGKEESGRVGKGSMGNIGGAGGAGTGFLGGREIGSGFSVGFKKRLASGIGIRESLKGGFSDFKKSLSLENIKKRSLEKAFGGPGLISSFVRGKLKKRQREKYLGESKDEITSESKNEISPKKVFSSDDMRQFNKVLPSIAKDVNIMKQNLQKLVKIWGGSEGKEREEDISFFEEQDRREEEIEASRVKNESVTETVVEESGEKKGGFLGTIIGLFSKGFMKAIKFIFNPKNLIKLFSKIFLPAVIIGTLFKGIMDGFKKYQETGNLKEAIIAGFGGMLNFLTFGLFGEEQLRNLIDKISNIIAPITNVIGDIFNGIKDFFLKLFGKIVEEDVMDGSVMKGYNSDTVFPVTHRIDEKTGKVINLEEEERQNLLKQQIEQQKLEAEQEGKTVDWMDTSPSTLPNDNQQSPLNRFQQLAIQRENQKLSEQRENEKNNTPSRINEINLPLGAVFDPVNNTVSYKGISFKANSQEELDKKIKAIDSKSLSSKRITLGIAGAAGAAGAAGNAVTSSVSGKAVTSGASGNNLSPIQKTPSGSEISTNSSRVSEEQRMEFSNDSATVIDKSSNNRSIRNTGSRTQIVPNVYDEDLLQEMID